MRLLKLVVLGMILPATSAWAQNTIQLERLQREVNIRQNHRGQPHVELCDTSVGCAGTTLPANGAYDEFEAANLQWVIDNVNCFREHIWDLDASGVPQTGSMLLDYGDPSLMADIFADHDNPSYGILSINDLAPSLGDLPTPPAELSAAATILQIESSINAMIDVLDEREYFLSSSSATAEVVRTATITSHYDEQSSIVDQMDHCEKINYALSNLQTTTSTGGINTLATASSVYFSDDCGGPLGYGCVDLTASYSTGYINVYPSAGATGGFLVFVRLIPAVPNSSDQIPGPVPTDEKYYFIGSVGREGGSVSVGTTSPPLPSCTTFGYSGWSMSTHGGRNDVLIVSAPMNIGDFDFVGPNMNGCSPDLTGIPSAAQPEAGEISDGPVMAPGCDSVTDSNPESEYPISYATGHKHEEVVDLHVSVPGPDWMLKRDYTSDPTVLSSSSGVLVGAGWTADPFCHLVFDDTGSNTVVTLVGYPQNTKTVFVREPTQTELDNESGAIWRTGGPTSQTLRKDTFIPDDSYSYPVPVWILEEPGQWQMVFYRDPSEVSGHPYLPDSSVGAAQGPESLLGFPLMWTDTYGNCRFYQYWAEDAAGGVARLRNIYLNGTPNLNIADAIVQFDWELDGTPSQIQGMLDKVSVLRPTETSGEYEVTQYVDYTYGAEPAGALSDDVGTQNDLVLVEHAMTVDDSEGISTAPMYSRWTHYRYHGGVLPMDPDERFEAHGITHQLKAIVSSEQIEYVAQKRVENGDLVSTPEHAVADTANWILTQHDDGDLGNWNSPEYLIFDMASKIIGYDDATNQNRVITEFIQTACGCGGGATQGQKIEFDFDSSYNWASTNPGRSVQESVFSWDSDLMAWSLHRRKFVDIEYLNGVPYTRYSVLEEPSGLQRQWITEYEYDSNNNLSIHSTPSWFADSTYSDVFSTGLPPAITGSASNGLRFKYEYDDKNYLTESFVWDSGLADFAVQREYKRDITAKPWLVTKESSFREYATSTSQLDNVIETIEYEYDFYNAGDNFYGRLFSASFTFGYDKALAAVSTHVESDLQSENGPSSQDANSSYVIMDTQGQPVWSVKEDGSMVYREFSNTTGKTTLRVENANPVAPAGANGVAFSPDRFGGLSSLSSVSSDWGREDDGNGLLVPMAGGELTTHYKHDRVGRQIETVTPGGNTYSTTRELKESPSRLGVLYSATVAFPHDMGMGTLPSRFDGPAEIQWMNAGGDLIEAASHTINEAASFDPLDEIGPVYTLETDSSGFDQGQLSRSVIDHMLSGLIQAEHAWHDVYRNASYTTQFEYDSLGRLSVALDPVGTATYYGYDVLDRMVEERLDDSLYPSSYDFASAILVSEQFYDADQDLSSPAQGVGNGLITVKVAYTGEGAETRTTKSYFDNRDRLVGVLNEELPTYSYKYDNLDRITESAVHSSLSLGGAVRASDDTADRGKFERIYYSQRGLAYLSEIAIDPSNGSTDYLRSDKWFDSRGRVIASREPSSPMAKMKYDSHSRVISQFTTDHGITTHGTGSYVNASSVEQDRVIEQVEYLYDDQSRFLRSTHFIRPHDASSSLLDALEGSDAVRMYTSYFYDSADRTIATANYGTGDTVSTVPFAVGLSEPTFPDAENPAGLAGSDALVSSVEYNRRGIARKSIDPAGIETLILYDDLARPVMTIENMTNVDDSDVLWDDGSSEPLDHRWSVSGFDYAYPEQDRATSLVYNGNGSIVKRVAHYPKEVSSSTVEGTQITEYVYGTIAGLSTNSQDTLVASGSLLFATLYPDETTGLTVRDSMASNYQQYSIEYARNRLGEVRGQRDQNGTELTYERDGLGRVVASVADQIDTTDDDTSNGGTDDNYIDDSTLRIETTFDGLGRVESSTSKDGELASSTVQNQVMFTYTPLWQNHEVKQEHDGVVDGASAVVTYEWANDATSNYSRLASITYPAQDGGVDPTVEVDYGDAGSLDDKISRVSRRFVETLGDNGVTHDPLVSYEFVGLSTPAQTRYDVATGIELSRTLAANGDENTGAYPGFDRFGRIKQQLWVDLGFGNHPADSELPAFSPIVQKNYDYDALHNRQNDLDKRPRARIVDRDLDYAYDSLHRLKVAERSGGQGSFQWNLDAFGNWEKVIQDKNGDGVYQASDDFVHDWSHSEANELTEYTMSKPISFPPGLLFTIPDLFQYDDNGNMRRSHRSSTDLSRRIEYIYDAWNRLVRVQQVKSAVVTVPILENEYNGLGWRIVRKSDTTQAGYDGIDESRSYYYSPSWQLLEEHVDSDNNGSPNWVSQQFWGSRHLNDAVAKRIDHDPNGTTPDYTDGVFFYLTDVLFSPLAIVREDSTLANRVFFGAYGMAEHHWPGDVDGDGAATSADLTMITSLSGKPGTSITDAVNYNVDAEADRNGLISPADEFLYNEQGARAALPKGWIDTNKIAYSGSTARTTADNSIGFAGAIFDPAIGMYQMRNRYYTPEWGRFINRDPLGYVDGQSVYQYVGSSPASRFDAMGLDWNWLPSVSDIVNGDTWLYQNTPSWSEFANGQTLANRAYTAVRRDGVVKSGMNVAAGLKHQFVDRPQQSGLMARTNAELAGAGYWESRFRGASVGIGTFFGFRDLYEGHVGEDVLTGDCLTYEERSDRLFNGSLQLGMVAVPMLRVSRPLNQTRAGVAANAFGYRVMGYTRSQSAYLSGLYSGMGHHFLPRRLGLPARITESRLNIMGGSSGLNRGSFYRRHALADSHFHGTRFPKAVGGTWRASAHRGIFRINTPSSFGRVWHSLPSHFRTPLSGSAAYGMWGAYSPNWSH